MNDDIKDFLELYKKEFDYLSNKIVELVVLLLLKHDIMEREKKEK